MKRYETVFGNISSFELYTGCIKINYYACRKVLCEAVLQFLTVCSCLCIIFVHFKFIFLRCVAAKWLAKCYLICGAYEIAANLKRTII